MSITFLVVRFSKNLTRIHVHAWCLRCSKYWNNARIVYFFVCRDFENSFRKGNPLCTYPGLRRNGTWKFCSARGLCCAMIIGEIPGFWPFCGGWYILMNNPHARQDATRIRNCPKFSSANRRKFARLVAPSLACELSQNYNYLNIFWNIADKKFFTKENKINKLINITTYALTIFGSE